MTISKLTLILGVAAAGLVCAQKSGDAWQRWLNEDVVYLIEPAERAAFERLQSDEERERFSEQFWSRRGGEPAKESHYKRIAYANERFAGPGKAGWQTDRGHIYIVYGPPDELESHPAQGREQWLYHQLPKIGANVMVEFVDAQRNGDFRQTRAPGPQR